MVVEFYLNNEKIPCRLDQLSSSVNGGFRPYVTKQKVYYRWGTFAQKKIKKKQLCCDKLICTLLALQDNFCNEK